MFEVIPAFSPEHRRAATLACRCMMSSVFHLGGAQWTQGSGPLQLFWRSAWWRGGLPHQHPGPSPPGPPVPYKEQKGTSCFTLALCHPLALFNLLPALLFFPLLRLCLCCVTAGCFFDGSLKENWKQKRDSLLNTETYHKIQDWGTLFLCQMFCGGEMWTVNEIAYS